MNMYSQQSYGLLHPVHPQSSGYPSWPQQPQQAPQPSHSSAGPMSDPTLPPGWLKQWNAQYQTWFFVNTYAQPAVSQWIHPAHSLPAAAGPPAMMGGEMAASDLAQRMGGAAGAAGPASAGPTAPAMQRQAGAVAAPQQPASKGSSKGAGLLAAGAGAMGGLALGGLLSHEWKEHQHRQQEHREHQLDREHDAYQAGIEHAEREHDFQLDHTNYAQPSLPHAGEDSADAVSYQEDNQDLSDGDDDEWE